MYSWNPTSSAVQGVDHVHNAGEADRDAPVAEYATRRSSAGVNGGSIGNGFGQPLGRRGWHARQIGRGQAGKPLRHCPAQPHVI